MVNLVMIKAAKNKHWDFFCNEIKSFTGLPMHFFGQQYCKCTFWVWAMMTIVCGFEKLHHGKVDCEVFC